MFTSSPCMEIGDIKAEVTSTLLKYELSSPSCWFMRFSCQDLEVALTALAVNVTQEPTKHSILSKSELVFWMFIPHDQCFKVRSTTEDERSQTHHPSYYNKSYHNQSFAAQLPPARECQVEQCLHDFMTRTANST